MREWDILRWNRNVIRGKIPQGISVGIKCLIAVWALSGDSLSLILSGYEMNVPFFKFLFTMLESLDGWGIENVFMALGIGTMFCLVRDRQKNPWLSGLSAFFAVCTVFGISYEKTSSWDCIFLFRLQFALACFVMLGYYFLYKNCILFIGYVFEMKGEWLRREPKNKIEIFLFQKYTFWGPLFVILGLGVPWLISFFPGTLQCDAYVQLRMYLGVEQKTGQFPVVMTELMGGCMRLGRLMFQSDSIGLFLYTILQFGLQTLVFSYGCYVMRKVKAPVLFSWLALLVWVVFPYFPIWGYTMVKDTMHYIFVLLLVVTIQDVLYKQDEWMKWWQIALFLISVSGITLTRNDGRYVVLITLLVAILVYGRYWKLFLTGIGICFLAVFAVEGIYMPLNNIESGPTGEMFSIPLQQTARYLRDHYDQVTEEEADVLQEGFVVELENIGSLYDPIISDPVKANFEKHPSTEYIKKYFKVWFQQFVKHPDTYMQAFLNHVYGYFYPDRRGYNRLPAVFAIEHTEHFSDGNMDMKFAINDNSIRKIFEHSLYLMGNTPVLSMFLSAGFHTYLLLGEGVYLWARKRKKEVLILMPGFLVLLICMVSPVNAHLRYMMPIMATLPVNAVWCYVMGHEKNAKDKKETHYEYKNKLENDVH